ncbi:MAG: hypothetical protein SVY15_03035 [Halobacteriota archaeon]|nr:hypothetical protein [Halobacteriota archaeon]
MGEIFEEKGEKYVTDTLLSRFGPDIIEITSKGVDHSVIDVKKVDPIKLAKYVEVVKKLGVSDPIMETGEHGLMNMMKSPHTTTKIIHNDEVIGTIDKVAVLKKGQHYGPNNGWGWEHIVEENHHVDVQNAFGLADDHEAVWDFMAEGLEKGEKVGDDVNWAVPDSDYILKIALGPTQPGSIITIRPIPKG